jgi:NitT/TauT family transport system ATP-binding protein
VGPSGCGKTTLLKCIGGLLAPSRGEVVLQGKRITEPPDAMAVVFQEYGRSLMPWTSVRKNVLLPLRHKHLSHSQRDALVEEAIEAVGLTRFLDHYPWQLSGGMQQRVAIARALAYQPSLVLQVRHQFHVTILFVTHDIDESVYLADRVVVLTHSPTEVKEILPIDLPRPRDQIATKALPEFADLRAHVQRLIRVVRTDEAAAAVS